MILKEEKMLRLVWRNSGQLLMARKVSEHASQTLFQIFKSYFEHSCTPIHLGSQTPQLSDV